MRHLQNSLRQTLNHAWHIGATDMPYQGQLEPYIMLLGQLYQMDRYQLTDIYDLLAVIEQRYLDIALSDTERRKLAREILAHFESEKKRIH